MNAIRKGASLKKVDPSELKRPLSPKSLAGKGSGGGGGRGGGGGGGFSGNPMMDEIRKRQMGGGRPAPGPPAPSGGSAPQRPTVPVPKRPVPPSTDSKPTPSLPSNKPTPPAPINKPTPPAPPTNKPTPAPPTNKPAPPAPPSKPTPSIPENRPAPPPANKPAPPAPPTNKPAPPTPTKSQASSPGQNEGNYVFNTDLPPVPVYSGIKKSYKTDKRGQTIKTASSLGSSGGSSGVSSPSPAPPISKPAPPAPPTSKPAPPAPPTSKPAPPPPSSRGGSSGPEVNKDEIIEKLTKKQKSFAADEEYDSAKKVKELILKITSAEGSTLAQLVQDANQYL